MLSNRHELALLFIMFEAGAVCDDIALSRCIFPLGVDELMESFIRWFSTHPRVELVPTATGLLSSMRVNSAIMSWLTGVILKWF